MWLHFNLSHTASLKWLERHSGLPDEFFEAIKDSLHSTRIERTDEALVAVINDAHFDFAFEQFTPLPHSAHARLGIELQAYPAA